MIFDLLENFDKCAAVPGAVRRKISAFLAGLPQEAVTGRYEIDEDRVFAMISEYDTKSPDAAARYEIHRKMADIQILLAGMENVGFLPLEQEKLSAVALDVQKDIGFLPSDMADGGMEQILLPGRFMIFMPGEGHAPGLSSGGRIRRVRKIVIKIDASLLEVK